VSQAQDPERLLADALRAQARSAPPGGLTPDMLPPRYGLLSGAGAQSLERERAAIGERATAVAAPAKPAAGPLPAYWILLLAVLLGLATGAVIGVITLI
jgi:hypothetical protein